jgi:ABC-type sulfate transport system permease subunit
MKNLMTVEEAKGVLGHSKWKEVIFTYPKVKWGVMLCMYVFFKILAGGRSSGTLPDLRCVSSRDLFAKNQ